MTTLKMVHELMEILKQHRSQARIARASCPDADRQLYLGAEAALSLAIGGLVGIQDRLNLAEPKRDV